MGSISSPDGPSISGYTQTQINNELVYYLNEFNSALSNYNSAKNDYYNVGVAAYQSNHDATLLNQKKTAYQNSVDLLQAAATNYATAMARQMIYADGGNSAIISTIITNLSSQTVDDASGFDGLTTTNYQNVQDANAAKEDTRTALLSAFNAYRYKEWQISDIRAQILKEQAQIQYDTLVNGTADTTQLDNLNSTLSSLLNDRVTTSANLDAQLSIYQSVFQNVYTVLVNIINSARTQAENWDQFIAQKQAESAAHIQTLLTQAQDRAAQLEQDHLTQYPTTNDPETNIAVEQASAQITEATQTLVTSGPGKVSIDVTTSNPTLPRATSTLTIGQVMGLISQVQLMMEQISREMSNADHRINSFRREIGQNDVTSYLLMRFAQDNWAKKVYAADQLYDIDLNQDNVETFVRITNIYKAYRDNLPVINSVINQINAEIDAQNLRNKALVDATNSLDPVIVSAINSAYANKPNTANTLDYTDQDTDITNSTSVSQSPLISYIPDIPHYPNIDINDLPAPPVANINSVPIDISNQNPLDFSDPVENFNSYVDQLASLIAPFKEQVQKALMTAISGSQTDYELLDLQKLYIRDFIPIRDNTLKTVYDGFFSFLYAFTRQLSAMSFAKNAKKEEENIQKILSVIFQKIDTLLVAQTQTGTGAGQSTSASEAIGGGGVGFSTADTKTKASAVGKIISQITASSQFTEILQSFFERIGIQAGLQAAGSMPAAASQLSTFGIPLSELGINITQAIEQQSTQTLIAALIGQLSQAIATPEGLKDNALQIILGSSEIKGLTPQEVQDVLANLIAMQQLLLTLIMAFLGTATGMVPEQLFASFGIKWITPDSLMKVLNKLQLTDPAKDALLILLKTQKENISLENQVPGGKAFSEILQETLKKDGIDLRGDITSQTLDQIFNALDNKAEALQLDIADQNLIRDIVYQDQIQQANINFDILGQDILRQIRKTYDQLPDSIKAGILNHTTNTLSPIPGITREDQAALIYALASQSATPQDISLLLALLKDQSISQTIIQLSTTSNNIIHKLFAKTDEQIQIEEKELKNQIQVQNRLYQEQISTTLPTDVKIAMKEAFEITSRNFVDDKFAEKAVVNFVKTIQNMTDFHKVALEYLLDPGRSIVREFSIITRSSGEKSQQSPIMLGG